MSYYRRSIRPVFKKIYYFVIEVFFYLLGLLFFWLRKSAPEKFSPSQILAIKIERIGDFVLSLPAVRALKKRYPGSKITVLISSGLGDLASADPCVDKVIVYEPQGKHKGLFGKIKLIKELREVEFDLAVDLTTRDLFIWPAVFTFFCRAKLTVGLDNLGRGFLFNLKVKPQKETRYYCREVAEILSPLGIIPLDAELVPKAYVLEGNISLFNQRLDDIGIKNNATLAVIHCGGYYSQQKWSPEGFAAVADHLSAKYFLPVFFVGSGLDQADAEGILRLCLDKKNKFNLAGRLSLGEMAALMLKASIFVGSSSGPSHIAYALGVPTVTILGPTIAKRWVHPGPRNISLQADMDCIPCPGECVKEEIECLKAIDRKKVVEAVDKQMNVFNRK